MTFSLPRTILREISLLHENRRRKTQKSQRASYLRGESRASSKAPRISREFFAFFPADSRTRERVLAVYPRRSSAIHEVNYLNGKERKRAPKPCAVLHCFFSKLTEYSPKLLHYTPCKLHIVHILFKIILGLVYTHAVNAFFSTHFHLSLVYTKTMKNADQKGDFLITASVPVQIRTSRHVPSRFHYFLAF